MFNLSVCDSWTRDVPLQLLCVKCFCLICYRRFPKRNSFFLVLLLFGTEMSSRHRFSCCCFQSPSTSDVVWPHHHHHHHHRSLNSVMFFVFISIFLVLHLRILVLLFLLPSLLSLSAATLIIPSSYLCRDTDCPR